MNHPRKKKSPYKYWFWRLFTAFSIVCTFIFPLLDIFTPLDVDGFAQTYILTIFIVLVNLALGAKSTLTYSFLGKMERSGVPTNSVLLDSNYDNRYRPSFFTPIYSVYDTGIEVQCGMSKDCFIFRDELMQLEQNGSKFILHHSSPEVSKALKISETVALSINKSLGIAFATDSV